jgi:hypothetical protein
MHLLILKTELLIHLKKLPDVLPVKEIAVTKYAAADAATK